MEGTWRQLDKDVDLREEKDWHSCQGKAHKTSDKPLAQWERNGLYLCDGCQQQAEQTPTCELCGEAYSNEHDCTSGDHSYTAHSGRDDEGIM